MFYQNKCTFCGECFDKCQYVTFDIDKSIEQMREIVNGNVAEIVTECITCGACNHYCPEDANPFDLINEIQERTNCLEIPEESLLMMGSASQMPSEIIKGEPNKPLISLCAVGDIIPGLFDGAIFEGMNFVKGGDYFCRIGFNHLGIESPVRDGASRFIENLSSLGHDEIIFFHDDCYALLNYKAKEYGIDIPFKFVHIIEFLRDYVKSNFEKINPINMKIAYQQPCASWCSMEKDTILDDFFSLVGATRLPRKYDKELGSCCGSPYMPRDREKGRAVRNRNIKDAKEYGAESIVYLCPICYMSMKKGASENNMRSLHLIHLAKIAIGEEIPI
ncbi:MAG: (Fe-S)-binding protein [Spirochaetota bacterium]|nr:(Fe-S)-binding protein [Spirochaetota bacterium]